MTNFRHSLGPMFSNISLKKKILGIVFISIFLVSSASLAGLYLVSSSYLTLLQNTVANNLSYSATSISYYLSNIETMSGLILSDSNIQSNLTAVKNSKSPRVLTNAYKNLSYTIQEYYQQYKPNYINYIALNNQEFITYSNFLTSKENSKSIESLILNTARKQDGRPIWICESVDKYGIFMGRLIKNIQSSSLDELGTLIVSIDFNRLMNSLSENSKQYGDVSYSILENDKIIYNENSVSSVIHSRMNELQKDSYSIMNINHHKYFVAKDTIPKFNWTYVCYVSYDSIFKSSTLAKNTSIIVIIVSIFLALAFSKSMIAFISSHTNNLIQKMKAFSLDENAIIDDIYDYSQRKDEFGALNRHFDRMAEKIRNLIQVNYVNEIWKKDAQLKALEMQINPHFLYNTLESINWRAKSSGNTDISTMVESLGTLLRATLSNNHSRFDLKKELEIVTAYITIQKYRFEDRLKYSILYNEDLSRAQIPKMIIQPLVENAINYGIEESTEICLVEIMIEYHAIDNVLNIFVKNEGSEFEDDILFKLHANQIKPHGFGIGLINIDERIKLMFGEEYGLTIYNEEKKAVVKIAIPYLTD